jgi:Skp family chaperone for outer membrane proteins
MNRFSLILATATATVCTATAAPKVALVRVKDIYSGLPATEELQKRIKAERDEIMKDQRAEELRKIISELQGLQARLSDKKDPLPEEASRKLARSYELKRQEAQTLQKEFESFRTEREKDINRAMVAGMRSLLDEILETSRRVGKEKGFDVVFDSSGDTNTGVPFVLYSRKSPDLTDDVTAAMKDAAVKKSPNKKR